VRIGELGRLTGVPSATIRYYERRGLLGKPQRTPSGYRIYPAEAGMQLRLIRWAKEVGFTLREIRDLLQVVQEHVDRPSDGVRMRFDAKLRQVETRMRDLGAMRDQLKALAACRCRGRCPIIAKAITGAPAPSKTRRSSG
jgi:MerR family mercuric resistance operon transcriptional regulator